MKTCPKCQLDYSNEFSYCEFDGIPLIEAQAMVAEPLRPMNTFPRSLLQWMKNKVLAPLPLNLINLNNKLLGVLMFLLLILGSIEIHELFNHLNNVKGQPASVSGSQSPLVIYTPKEALEFNSKSEEPNLLLLQGDLLNSAAKRGVTNYQERPGVTVYPHGEKIPQKTNEKTNEQKKSIDDNKSQPSIFNKPGIYKNELPTEGPIHNKNRSNTDLPISTNINPDTSLKYHGASLQIVNVTPRPTAQGVHYQITLRAQNSGGRVIQWNTLTIGASGISVNPRSSNSIFDNRLGSPGSLTFTINSPTISQLTPASGLTLKCSLHGKTVDNTDVRVAVSIPIHP